MQRRFVLSASVAFVCAVSAVAEPVADRVVEAPHGRAGDGECGETSVASPFSLAMPDGFVLSRGDASGKTWRETGILDQPFAMGCATMRATMRRQGFRLVHDLRESANSAHILQLWRGTFHDVILLLWQEDLFHTGVSWGDCPRAAGGSGGSTVEPGILQTATPIPGK